MYRRPDSPSDTHSYSVLDLSDASTRSPLSPSFGEGSLSVGKKAQIRVRFQWEEARDVLSLLPGLWLYVTPRLRPGIGYQLAPIGE